MLNRYQTLPAPIMTYSFAHSETIGNKILFKIKTIYYQNSVENVVCKFLVILFQPYCFISVLMFLEFSSILSLTLAVSWQLALLAGNDWLIVLSPLTSAKSQLSAEHLTDIVFWFGKKMAPVTRHFLIHPLKSSQWSLSQIPKSWSMLCIQLRFSCL